MIIVTDIDHTISDATWRDPLLGKWEEYYAAGKADRPIRFVVEMLRALVSTGDYELMAVTGRPEKWRDLTVRWLIENNVPVERLYMRSDHDHRPSHHVKVEIVRGLKPVAFVVEDNDRAIAAYREIGLNVFTVNQGRPSDG